MIIPKDILDLIVKARKLQIEYDETIGKINEYDMDNDFENITVNGDNSTNLSEAIQCFINYGEDFEIDGFRMLKEFNRRTKNGN